MYMTEKVKQILPRIVEWMTTLPADWCVNIFDSSSDIEPHVQAWNQQRAAAVRATLPGLVWKKEYKQQHSWWEYSAFAPNLGCRVVVYGVTEAPPTCTVTRREIEVEEDVPVAFERRLVKKEVVEVVCGE